MTYSEPSARPDLSADLPRATRGDGLERLTVFQPFMGRHYAAKRNYDFGPRDRSNVSGLSAHIRHRLISEAELVTESLEAHSFAEAEKFIQEVCWRTYWKGWLEQRPSVWSDYRAGLDQDLDQLETDRTLARRYREAVEARTGLACFDAWVSELIETGYLHNHARMWFASIWVYTLNLPWRLGADFFLRHLMDGDAASNTLSWRWVCGLQTVGKTYLARADNIETFTAGRFDPPASALAKEALPLDPNLTHPAPQPVVYASEPDRSLPSLVLVHDEDGLVEDWNLDAIHIVGLAGLASAPARSRLETGEVAAAVSSRALEDAIRRAQRHLNQQSVRVELSDLPALATSLGARQIVTQRVCVGPLRDQLHPVISALDATGVAWSECVRDWDRAFYPHANKGFFKLKKAIPTVLAELGLA